MRLLKLALMCLMVSGCGTFPTLHPYILSVKNGQCGEYQEVGSANACTTQFQFVKWHPMSDCEGFFALPATDIAALKEFQKNQCTKANSQ